MTLKEAKAIKPGDYVIAFNGNATLYGFVISTAPHRDGLQIKIRYLLAAGKIGERTLRHRSVYLPDGEEFEKCMAAKYHIEHSTMNGRKCLVNGCALHAGRE